MSRLQKKCVFGSMLMHILLLALVVVSSAFVRPPPPPENIRYIKIFDAAKLTDAETSGGGNPNIPSDTPPSPPPAAPVKKITPPVNEPPVRIQEPVEPIVTKKIETPKPPKTKTDLTKVVKKTEPKPIDTPKPEKPKLDLTPRKATVDPDIERRKIERKKEQEREEAETARREQAARDAAVAQANRIQAQRQAAISDAIGSVADRFARSGTTVEMPGPGGEAFINYADVIWNKYYQAWQTPEGEVRSPVRVEIVVARDGRVISANIIGRSGDAALDKSVRQALDRVRSLPAFPEGAKDAQRTFKITFSLNAKRKFG